MNDLVFSDLIFGEQRAAVLFRCFLLNVELQADFHLHKSDTFQIFVEFNNQSA